MGVEATPLVGHVLVQYWRRRRRRWIPQKESRCSHRGRISSVAFVNRKSSESFADDHFRLSSTKNLGGVARRRISVAMRRRISVALLDGGNRWLSFTNKLLGRRQVKSKDCVPSCSHHLFSLNPLILFHLFCCLRVRYSPSSSSLTWQVRTTEIEKKEERTDSGLFWRGTMAELRHSSSWKPCTERRIGGVSGILENGLFCLCVSLVANLTLTLFFFSDFCNAVVVAKIKNATLILLVLKQDQIVKTLETIKRVSPRRALLMGMAQVFGHHKSFRPFVVMKASVIISLYKTS
ncbi:hypothetical protein Bca52824_069467 [Brassica carinata]|uniref:Uncharacterized protein n=1 Tax=Brassica carinata TaxID=52824 RepID=A0A8X7Q3L8_BRACI|nr:hypothetical protein Bca52824_069467 [Brassica carinata]